MRGLMRVLDLFSGVGGFAVASERVGWETAAFCEIDPFARRVLAKHWPRVRVYDDVRTIDPGELGRVDLISGGFPCQDLSVAGKRAGLAGGRSGLFWEIVRLARALRPAWLVLENVPGLLSSECGRDMATVVGALNDLGYLGAWRVLDAQWFGVAQRRRRVFFVAGLGERCLPALLAFLESGQRDTAPRRSTGEGPACGVIKGAAIGRQPENGPQRGDWVNDVPSFTLNCTETHAVGLLGPLAGAVSCKWAKGTGGPSGDECQNLVPEDAYSLTARNAQDRPESGAATRVAAPETAYALRAYEGALRPESGASTLVLAPQGPSGTLQASGAGRARPAGMASEPDFLVAFNANDYGNDAVEDLSPVLRCGGIGGGGVHTAIAISGCETPKLGFEVNGSLRAEREGYVSASSVRRLTPTECERLQGFSWLEGGEWQDGHTCLCGKNRGRSAGPDPCTCADGPRYRTMGNAIAVPCAEWIFRQIAESLP